MKFNAEQRRRLIELGLLDEQIRNVERNALLAGRAALVEDPTLQDVRDKFNELIRSIDNAQGAMSALLHANNNTPAWAEIFQRVELADFKGILNDQGEALGGDGEAIERAWRALLPAARVVKRAKDAFDMEASETKQRRSNSASFFPVQLIDEALQTGFLECYRREAPNGGQDERPPYNVPRTSSQASKFREVMEICYEAMGREGQNLERPIRAYLEWCRERESSQ